MIATLTSLILDNATWFILGVFLITLYGFAIAHQTHEIGSHCYGKPHAASCPTEEMTSWTRGTR